MNNIKFNAIYNDENILLENILDDLVERKKNTLIWSIKSDITLIYNKDENYLSTKREVDKN